MWQRYGWTMVFGCVLGAGVLGGGCAHYVNYPAIGGDRLAVHDPNVAPVPDVVVLAVRRVVTRHTVGEEFVVNLPEGMDRRVAERVVGEIGGGARVVSPETDELPAVHVKRVWVRGDRAAVVILRPVDGLGGGGHQAVTVRLEKPVFGVWEVVFERAWAAGAAETPELFGWSEDWDDGGG